ncbi:MAG TPA: type 4a pilus biogenesis protein PilO [Candidatus Acidoferrum sp.]|nr:type 4a pilus biogenesis protein PilO [Candidatus Acidoferrum sp.]
MKALLTKLTTGAKRWVNELKTFNWNDLNNPDTIGVWPTPVKLLLCTVLFAICLGAGYWFIIKEQQEQLDRVTGEESGLKTDIESKAVLAANLQAYRQQMKDMEESFGDLLRQLPGQTEVPGLLEDITFVGYGSGLAFQTIALDKEAAQEFYIESPIKIEVKGTYHDFGSFVSGVSSLSRIVTLHDFAITSEGKGELRMKITAKTYRYKSGDGKSGEAKK